MELVIVSGLRAEFLPGLLVASYREWQRRNPDGQGILLSTDTFWRKWSTTSGIRVDDPENVLWNAQRPVLWFLGEQARSVWPDFKGMPYRGDYFLIGSDLREILAWLPIRLSLSVAENGLAFGWWQDSKNTKIQTSTTVGGVHDNRVSPEQSFRRIPPCRY
jgi:hypothetical protein